MMWPDLGHRQPAKGNITSVRRSLFVLDPTTLRANRGPGQTDPNILSYPKYLALLDRLAEQIENASRIACGSIP